MSYNNGPRIVTDGLVLHLDAGNSRSYTGAGTVWTDLNRNGNTGSLFNGPAYSSANGGNIVFDGGNDYVDFYAPNLSTIATVEMWCKIGAGYSSGFGKMFFGWYRHSVWCNGGNLGYNTSNSDVYGISSSTVSSLGLVDNWKHYVFEMRADVSYTNNKIYINAAPQTLSQLVATENSSWRNFNGGVGRIAAWGFDISYCMPMNCASFKVYNRILSPAEIRQNYHATKGRFGL
jgi:hypothetical protein